jgi:flagellar FliL protein
MSTTTTAPAANGAAEEQPKHGGKKKLIIVVVLVLALAGGGYWFFLKPKGPTPPPEPGAVTVLEPVQVNLEGGHYLRLGIALQQTSTVAEAVDGSKALDAAIELFTGLDMNDLTDPKVRHKLKDELTETLVEDYEHEVMGVYFTEFVTQ